MGLVAFLSTVGYPLSSHSGAVYKLTSREGGAGPGKIYESGVVIKEGNSHLLRLD